MDVIELVMKGSGCVESPTRNSAFDGTTLDCTDERTEGQERKGKAEVYPMTQMHDSVIVYYHKLNVCSL